MSEIAAAFIGPAKSMPASQWDRLANPNGDALPHPFTRHAFFVALEESGSADAKTGWKPTHLILQRGDTPIALLPLYLKSHSYGEYVFDHGWAEAFARAGGKYYPKLQASVPFTPVTGPRLMIAVGEDRDRIRDLLVETCATAVVETRASSLHITFMPEDDWSAVGKAGFLLRTNQQFHWENRGYSSFGEFLGELASAKRKNLRKERAAIAAEGVTFDLLSGSDLSENAWDAFFEGYIETGNTKWNPPYLTREFFSRIGQTMSEQILLVMAKKDGRYIAGALNFFDGDAIYGRNWGATTYMPFLHFETCYYQAIDFAIARKLARVEAGAQGGHKLLRGYQPRPTFSAHYVVHEGLRRAVGDYLVHERQEVLENMEMLAARAPFKKNG